MLIVKPNQPRKTVQGNAVRYGVAKAACTGKRVCCCHRGENHGREADENPHPEQVQCPDVDLVAVEFLATGLSEHVRAFFDEQRRSAMTK